MKFLVSLLLIILLSFAACLYLPWWTIAPVAFVVTLLIPQSAGASFLSSFLAIFIFWSLLTFSMSLNNEHILASKVSQVMIGMESHPLLILATGLLGGVVAGFAGLSGSLLRRRKRVAEPTVEVTGQ
jgi:cbb3-type cytochrome oxidase subunit 1